MTLRQRVLGQETSDPGSEAGARTLKVAVLAFVLGSVFVFVAGFASPQTIHNAAHDTRHALGFPCH
ncbi:MAG: CbtB domain-containing protein [Hyphomicrobiaceae bacterium]